MNKNSTSVIGLMSGTSLDGVDLALIEFAVIRKKVTYRIVKGATYPYPKPLSSKLQNCRTLSGLELTLLDRELGRFYGKLINTFKSNHQVDLISSHGHTVFHQPEKGLTLQIGSGAEIAALTGIKTICDFRTTDVALGGQGAPLVPFGDELLFGKYDYCLNLGGYANISYSDKKTRKAFDVCPCNVVLNSLANLFGKAYDDKGKTASKGKVNETLLEKLNALGFYHQKNHKSLGNEWVEKNIQPLLKKSRLQTQDLLATFVEHIAIQLSKVISGNKSVLVTGGGAMNNYLMVRLTKISGAKIRIPEPELIHFKEALIFGLLGYMRDKEWINTLASATGAQRNSSGGAIYHP